MIIGASLRGCTDSTGCTVKLTADGCGYLVKGIREDNGRGSLSEGQSARKLRAVGVIVVCLVIAVGAIGGEGRGCRGGC